jgi:hypothetical protein
MTPRASTPHVLAASLATTDLRIELEHRRSGKDDRTTIEHHREMRRNPDGDFDAADSTPVRQAARTPTSLARSGGGCMALAPVTSHP